MTAASILLYVAALVGVLGLIGVATHLLRAGIAPMASGTARTLVVQESLALDARRRIHLVQCGSRQVLILTGGAQELVVGWIGDQ